MSSITNITDLKAAIVRRFISGETYPVICKDYDLTVGKARDLSRIFIAELWTYIRNNEIEHPYTPENYGRMYKHGSNGGRFYEYFLTTTDMRGEREFWLKLIDRIVEHHGGVQRPLVPEDAFERLELTVRATTILRREGVKTIQDLLNLIANRNHWINIAGMGDASRTAVMEKLVHHGFKLESEQVLPSTLNLMKSALAYVKNPHAFTEQEKTSLLYGLERRISLG